MRPETLTNEISKVMRHFYRESTYNRGLELLYNRTYLLEEYIAKDSKHNPEEYTINAVEVYKEYEAEGILSELLYISDRWRAGHRLLFLQYVLNNWDLQDLKVKELKLD